MPARNVIEIVIKGDDQVSDVTDKVAGKISGFGKTAVLGIGAVAASTVALGSALFELGREAAPIEGIQKAFEGVAKSSGKSADEVLDALKKGSYGMIAQKDLMESYNTAAQLVGTTFANQLPDAMQYLSKVSAATGQDMGFMMDSLVKGVGRLSPMILDNLGIQVNVTEANEAYAKTLGKSADQMTKQEQQAALMNQVLEKLKTNTAAMPEVVGSATQQWASFQTKLTDFKDKLGVKLLPFFTKVVEILSKLADAVLPVLEKVVMAVGTAFQWIAERIGGWPFRAFFLVFEDGSSLIGDFLHSILGIDEGVSNQVAGVIDTIFRSVESFVQGALQVAGDLINNFFIPALSALASFVTGTVIPAIQSFVQWLSATWEQVRPALEALANWFISTALPAIVNFVQNTVLPTISNFFTWLGQTWETVRPALEALFNWFVTEALPAIVSFVQNTVLPAVQDFFNWLGQVWEVVSPALSQIFDWFVTTAMPAIIDFVNNVALPVIQNIFNFVRDAWTLIEPALSSIFDWFVTTGFPAIVDFVNNIVLPAIQGIINLVSAIWITVQPFLNDFKTGVEGVFNWIKTNIIEPFVNTIQSVIDKFNELRGNVSAGVEGAAGIASGLSSGQFSVGDVIGAIGAQIRGYATQGSYVPDTGLYMLHRGEQVSNGSSQGGQPTTININFTGGGVPMNQADANNAGFMIVSGLRAKGFNV